MRMIISIHRFKTALCKLKSTTSVDLKTTEYITKMSDDVEQITKAPIESNAKTKEKDPKKVAAGKRLAEYNKRAKEKMKRDAEKATEPEERETGESQNSKNLTAEGWIPEISFTTAISIVGFGLAAINMFMSYRKDTKVDPPLTEPHPIREPCSSIERPQQSKIPIPKMGML